MRCWGANEVSAAWMAELSSLREAAQTDSKIGPVEFQTRPQSVKGCAGGCYLSETLDLRKLLFGGYVGESPGDQPSSRNASATSFNADASSVLIALSVHMSAKIPLNALAWSQRNSSGFIERAPCFAFR